MTNTWDIYLPHAVGLSDMFHRLDSMTSHNTNYPPYNLVKHDASNYEVQIALAGFKKEEIEVSTEQNILRVATTHAGTDPKVEYLHKGVSKRSFTFTKQLADDVRVIEENIEFDNGLLRIPLQKIVPEHQKKKVYKINSKSKPELLTE